MGDLVIAKLTVVRLRIAVKMMLYCFTVHGSFCRILELVHALVNQGK